MHRTSIVNVRTHANHHCIAYLAWCKFCSNQNRSKHEDNLSFHKSQNTFSCSSCIIAAKSFCLLPTVDPNLLWAFFAYALLLPVFLMWIFLMFQHRAPPLARPRSTIFLPPTPLRCPAITFIPSKNIWGYCPHSYMNSQVSTVGTEWEHTILSVQQSIKDNFYFGKGVI